MVMTGKDLIDQYALGKRDFQGVDLTGATIPSGTVLEGIDLYNATLIGLDAQHVVFINSKLCRANLSGSNLSCSIFTGANLEQAFLNKTTLFKTDFTDANLGDACLQEANLEGATLIRAKLIYANFYKASLIKANLASVVAQKTMFSCANLREARLSNGVFTKSDFSKADMYRACLSESCFHRVRAAYSVLIDADMRNVTGLDTADFMGAIGNGIEVKSAQICSHTLVWWANKVSIGFETKSLAEWKCFIPENYFIPESYNKAEWERVSPAIINLIESLPAKPAISMDTRLGERCFPN